MILISKDKFVLFFLLTQFAVIAQQHEQTIQKTTINFEAGYLIFVTQIFFYANETTVLK